MSSCNSTTITDGSTSSAPSANGHTNPAAVRNATPAARHRSRNPPTHQQHPTTSPLATTTTNTATGATTATQPRMPGCVWTNEAVTLLLSLYLREQQLSRQQKLKKKDVWRGICTELWRRGLSCSWQECDKKYRNLKQTFVRNLKQAGKKECRWMFFPLMLEINRHEPFVGDAVMAAVHGGGGGGGVGTVSGGAKGVPDGRKDAQEDDERDDDGTSDGGDSDDVDGDGDGESNLYDPLGPETDPIGFNATRDGCAPPYTPAPSPPGVINLSQRPTVRRSTSPPEPMPFEAKRRRCDNNIDYGFISTVIKTETFPTPPFNPPTTALPTMPMMPTSFLHHPNDSAAIVKRSFSPYSLHSNRTQIEPEERAVPKPPLTPPPLPSAHNMSLTPPFEQQPLAALDIRLLQAAMPFVRNGNGFGQHEMRHLQNGYADHNGIGANGLPGSEDAKVVHMNGKSKAIVEQVRRIFNGDAKDDSSDDDGDDKQRDHVDDRSDGRRVGQQQQQPPEWFHQFMSEFRRHEQRKLQQITELCAEVRRTNDIEQQRNHILNEKNEILRHMNSFMLNK